MKTECFVTVKWEYNKEEGEKAHLPHHRYNLGVTMLKIKSMISHLVDKDEEFFFIFVFSQTKNLFSVITK